MFFGATGCTDLIDNDEDGLTDLDDPGCLDANDETEVFDDRDGDGISNEDELALGTNPDDEDTDHDGVLDGDEIGDPESPFDSDSDTGGRIDCLDPDDDGDGWLTINEDANGNGDFSDDDTDGDGIPNYLDWDSDDDTYSDGEEILAGSDPLDPLDLPLGPPPVRALGPWGLGLLIMLLAGAGAQRSRRFGRV